MKNGEALRKGESEVPRTKSWRYSGGQVKIPSRRRSSQGKVGNTFLENLGVFKEEMQNEKRKRLRKESRKEVHGSDWKLGKRKSETF
jgi:hypothetical protein